MSELTRWESDIHNEKRKDFLLIVKENPYLKTRLLKKRVSVCEA